MNGYIISKLCGCLSWTSLLTAVLVMLIVSAKFLLTMEVAPMLDGAIAVEKGEIIDVGREEDLLARYRNAQHEDYPHHALLPGLINAHSHLDMTLHRDFPNDPVRSLLPNVDYVNWLLACIDHKKKSRPERQRTAVEEGLTAMIEAGTTCVGDMGSFEGICESVEQARVRAVIFPEVLSYDSRVAKDLFETALAIMDKYLDFDSELIDVGIGPYSAYTLSRNLLRIMSQHGHSSQIPLMIHVAESFAEMEFFYNSTGEIAEKLFPIIGWGENLPPAFGKTPIHYLDEIQFFASEPILVGCVNVTNDDLDRIARSHSKIIWCPRSNDYLKLGQPPIADILAKKIPLALGTDGMSSTNSLSLWDEMRSGLELAKIADKGAFAKELLKMTTIQSAEVLGLGAKTGSLKPGKLADYLLVRVSDSVSISELEFHLVQNTKSYHVERVVVGENVLKMVN